MFQRFLRDGRFLTVTVGVLVVAGLSSLTATVRQEDPTITNGVATIVTLYPGATAERVESQVTDPLEDELREVSDVVTITSSSRPGVSLIVVELTEKLRGAETEPAFAKVRDAVDSAATRLPRGAHPPVFDDDRFGAYTRITAVKWVANEPPNHAVMKRYAESLQDRLRGVYGTELVDVYGARTEEIIVRYDRDQLAALGIPATAIGAALQSADTKVAAGTLRSSETRVVVEVAGELDSLARIREVPLASHGGRELRLGDVATVSRGTADPPREMATSQGRDAVLVAARLGPGIDYAGWSDRVDERLTEFNATVPDGLVVDEVFDQRAYTETRLEGLVGNLFMGLALVFIVLFVSLGWRSALLVGAALPLVSLTAIFVLRLLGVPIHQMSVTGLIVALGLVVDAAIVMVDAIGYRLKSGDGRWEAVSRAVERLWIPLLGSTLTTVLAFMPILLLPGRAGEFVGAIGLSVIVALCASYVLAMLVVAPLAGRFLRVDRTQTRFLDVGLRWQRARRWFEAALDASLKYPKTSLVLASILPLLGFALASTLPKQFFPPADRDQFYIEVRMPTTAGIGQTRAATERIDEALADFPEVESVHWIVGRSAPPFYYNMKQDQDGNPAFAQALIVMSDAEAFAELMPRLQHRLDGLLPEGQVLVRELLQGPPVDAPLAMRVYGDDVGALQQVGEQLRERMSRVDLVTHSQSTLSAGSPKLVISADESRARLAGLGLADVAKSLDSDLEGRYVATVLEGPEELPVRVRAADDVRDSAGAVATTPLPSRPDADSGVGVPLSALGTASLEPVLDNIPRRNGERVNEVRGFTYAGVYPETATAAFNEVLAADPVVLPPGVRLETAGDAEKRSEAMGNLFASVPALLVLMLAAVVLTLSSFRLAAVVFVIAVEAIGLGMLSLAIFGYPLGFNSTIGLIGLVGVAVNAAIIIQSALDASPAAKAGDALAVRQVVVGETSRHILSTTVTTFGGFLPLLLSGGGFWPPFATGIAGGVLLSGLLSFFFVPQAFLLVTRWRQRAQTTTALAPAVEPAT